jgi:hypothetical protein
VSVPRNRERSLVGRAESRRRRARRFAVRLHNARRRDQELILRRLLGPSSWRCHPYAAPHPERGTGE